MEIWEKINDQIFDLVIIGAGGAGMSSALFGAKQGLKVLLVEETEFVGGTTAFSAGTTWIPNTYLAESVGCDGDSKELVKQYLQTTIGLGYNEAMIEAFLVAGPEAIKEIQKETSVRYKARPLHPDYQSEEEGAMLFGRALEPLPFDGKKLKKRFSLVRPPIQEFTILGGLMIDRDDINHLLNMTKSAASLSHSLKLISRYGIDRLKYPRGTKLVMGNALIASLLHSLDQRDVPILLETTVVDIDILPEEMLKKIILQHGQEVKSIRTKNIIFSTGGINRNITYRQMLTPDIDKHWCPGATGNTGSLHTLLQSKDVKYGQKKGPTDYFWAPVSVRKRADGTQAVFPHFILDRGKPHMITVNQAGQRFVNESTSYHLFGVAMQKQADYPVFLITDQQGLKKYGLGMVRPNSSEKALQPFLKDGYLMKAKTIEELGKQLKIPPSTLKETIMLFNQNAEKGIDPHFNRGTTEYQRVNGDPSYSLNPNLGAVKTAPFYAVALYPGDIGASTGIRVTPNAEVLNRNGEPLEGVYAVGNDMHSIMEGTYPGPGITLGPGLVFSWIAIKHMLAKQDYQ